MQYGYRMQAARGLGRAAAVGVVTLGFEHFIPNHNITVGVLLGAAALNVGRAGLKLVQAEYQRGRADEMEHHGHYVRAAVDSTLVQEFVDPANADLPGVDRGILIPYEASEAIANLPLPPEALEA